MPTPDTVLVIPAAGAGTRLQSSVPKVLSPVGGRAMIDYLLERYRHTVQRFVLVVHPSFEDQVRRHVERSAPSLDVDYATQANPTGMLDAILLASDAARSRAVQRVWVTWCDQIGIHPRTIETVERLSRERADAAAIFPTSRQQPPYIHFDRDMEGRIAGVRQRREGDEMPAVGESDMGLFSLSADAYCQLLPRFAAGATEARATHERNFLPFLPWLVQHGHAVLTCPATDPLEAIGVNTPDDRHRLEAYLRTLEQS